jgi:alkanesulfonate monooxygenase SsuD/methylene tetrahydromethanopterin reductase-like flavin-dependent oxidoreductase (luciferase family)
MFPNPPGLLRLEPHSDGLRDRIWWGAASNATAQWAGKLGMNLQSSTLKKNETNEPFHVQQAAQIRLYREAYKEAGHTRPPRVGEPQHLRADERSRPRLFRQRWRRRRTRSSVRFDRLPMIVLDGGVNHGGRDKHQSNCWIRDEAIAEAMPFMTVPNQLGVDYNAHVIGSILKHVAPALGWR